MRYEKGKMYFKSMSHPLVYEGDKDDSFPSKKGIGTHSGVDILYKDSNIPEDKRIYSFIGTKEVVDRDRDVVEIKGINLENYKRNPVVLWGHDQGETPIGRTVGLTHDKNSKSLIFDIVFASTEKGREIETLVKEGMLNSTSIGFIVKDFEYDENDNGGVVRLTETELLEISIVNVPANQEAVSSGVKDNSEEETKTAEPMMEQEELRDVIRNLIEDVLEEQLGEKEEPEELEEASEEDEVELGEVEINEDSVDIKPPKKEGDSEDSVEIDYGQLINLLQEINSKLESKPEPDKEVEDENTETDSQDPEEEPKESEEAQPDEESSEEDKENHSEDSPEDEKPDGSNLVSVEELEDEEEFIIITEEE